jgi:signal transduction histidine kinase
MNYFDKINQLSEVELFFAILIFACGLFYLHFFLSYSWNQKELKLLEKKDDYNLIGFGFWGMMICIFTLTPLFTEKDSWSFTVNIIVLLFSIVAGKYYYFSSLRKLLKLPKFDKYYKKLVFLFLGVSITLLYRSFDLGVDLLFDTSKITASNSILRNIMIPYELKSFVKILFIPNFLFCFIAYIYLIIKSYQRKEFLITFGVSFTLLAVVFSNSYHLLQLKYWMPLNVIADVFELFRLNIAQKNKIHQNLIETQERLSTLNDLEQTYENMNLKHKVFKHDLANKFQSSQLNLQRAHRLLSKDDIKTEEVKKSVSRALEAQELANDFFHSSSKVTDINLKEFTDKISDFVGIKTTLKTDSELDISFNSSDFNNIFMNIIKNAKEANLENDNSWVEVHFTKNSESSMYEFQIVDSGIYDEINNKEKIFESGVSSKGDDDRGLGLYSIKNIIKKHKGTISLSKVGENTCVSFSLPIPT